MSAGPLPPHRIVIGRMHENEIDRPKLRGIIEPVRDVFNIPVPMVGTPALDPVRTILMSEFSCAREVTDAAFADLIGRPTIRLRLLLLIGDPGGGKLRFARRLGELLGLSIWRVDASQSDGATLGGTERRWHSAECCHSLLAIAHGKTADPLVLLDELEKAATRNDNGGCGIACSVCSSSRPAPDIPTPHCSPARSEPRQLYRHGTGEWKK